MTISEDRGIVQPTPYVIKSILPQPEEGSDPSLIYGIELEIEGVTHVEHPKNACTTGFVYHEDGSLRNNGAEYVTHPMRRRELAYCLNQFFMKNKFTEANYSERCSVHVHTNVGDLTWEQLRTLILVYLVFEHVLFRFIGHERDKNIFCVPLYDTMMLNRLLSENLAVQSKAAKWEKYTALNLLPIYKDSVGGRGLGTVEWRHMAGTNDVKFILLWCDLIGKIFMYARQNSWEAATKFFLELNTSSAYREAMMEVFQELSPHLESIPGFEMALEEGVLRVKYALSKESKITLARKNPFGYVFDDLGPVAAPEEIEPLPTIIRTFSPEEYDAYVAEHVRTGGVVRILRRTRNVPIYQCAMAPGQDWLQTRPPIPGSIRLAMSPRHSVFWQAV